MKKLFLFCFLLIITFIIGYTSPFSNDNSNRFTFNLSTSVLMAESSGGECIPFPTKVCMIDGNITMYDADETSN